MEVPVIIIDAKVLSRSQQSLTDSTKYEDDAVASTHSDIEKPLKRCRQYLILYVI